MLRTVRVPDSRVRHAALLEDEASIQVSLMEVVHALLRGTIELKRAELILRALNTAVRNIRRVKFGLHADEMVKEVPTYPTPPVEEVAEPAPPEPRRRFTNDEVARRRAAVLAEYHAGSTEPKPAATAHVATDAFVGPPNTGPALHHGKCGDSRPRLSKRPGSTGPQLS